MPAPSPEAWVSTPVTAATAAVLSGAKTAEEVLSQAVLPLSVPPILSSSTGHWGSFVGMVQDVWDAELFVLRDSMNNSAILAEDVPSATVATVAATPAPSSAALSERLPVYLVAPPGLSPWASPHLGHPTPTASGGEQRSKRRRDDAPDVPERSTEGPSMDVSPMEDAGPAEGSMPPPPAKKQSRETPSSPTKSGLGPNTPLGGGSAVISKFYGVDATALKVHSLLRVTGIVAAAPDGASAAWEGMGGDDAGFFADEIAARNPAGIPRLHVVKFQVLSGPSPLNPLLAGLHLSAARAELLSTALPQLRQELIQYLAGALGGDALAAEYVLMNALGRATIRTGAGAVIGKLSVNVVLPKDGSVAVSELVEALRNLLPAVAHVRVNIPSLNAASLFPIKDYEANRLRSAPLQLSAGCMLIADETSLDNGQLEERGVKNVKALSSVASKAVVPVDFKYYETELPFDATSLYVSSGCKSIVPVDAVVRVSPGQSQVKSWRSYDADSMRKLRLAVALLADNAPDSVGRQDFVISEAVGKLVEESFVQSRQSGIVKGTDGQEVLSRWLAVARLSARSFGSNSLQEDSWRYAFDLERRREKQNTVRTQIGGVAGPNPQVGGRVAAQLPVVSGDR